MCRISLGHGRFVLGLFALLSGLAMVMPGKAAGVEKPAPMGQTPGSLDGPPPAAFAPSKKFPGSTKSECELAGQKAKDLGACDSDVQALISVCTAGSSSAIGASSTSATSSEANCPASADVATENQILHVHYSTIDWVAAGDEFRITSSSLATLPSPFPTTTPDTVAYVLKCSDITCKSGSVAHIHDDVDYPTDLSSSAHYTPSAGGYYRGLVVAYDAGKEGTATIIVANGTHSYSYTNQVFAGFRRKNVEVRPGDVLFVGKNNNTDVSASPPAGMPGVNNSEYADTTMVLLSNPSPFCTGSSCGDFRFNDDAWTFPSGWIGLSRIVIPASETIAWGTSSVAIVGTYDNSNSVDGPWRVNGRYIHVRRHLDQGGAWDCPESYDNDNDSLPHEVEAAVGSCDKLDDAPSAGAGIQGQDCSGIGSIVNAQVNALALTSICSVPPTAPVGAPTQCWNASDSDNDGKPDDWELGTGAVHCVSDPAASPYGYAGTCSRFALTEESAFCSGYGSCWGENVSALSNPDVAVYDIFVRNDYFNCTGTSYCSNDYLSQTNKDNSITSAQAAFLPQIWTQDPITCWDGTAWPCSNTIDSTKDLPYRAKMHVYSGNALSFPDTTALSNEIGFDGAKGGHSWFDGRFQHPWRYMGLAFYSVASFYGGGQTDGRASVWGNPPLTATSSQIARVFSHELGHSLTLRHPNNNTSNDANGGASGKCTGTTGSASCTTSGCACNACGANGACLAAGADTDNPGAPSIMSYNWESGTGMLPKSPNLPPTTTQGANRATGCGNLNLRFSKGLGSILREYSLPESLAQSPQAIKLAQDLACFRSVASGCGSSCNPFRPSGNGQWCDGTNCFVDWNQDAATTAFVQVDLTRGPFFGASTCNYDVLPDWDEWRTIFARGRTNLGNSYYMDVALLATPFNAASTVVNHAGWDSSQLPVNSSVTIGLSEVERNVCTSTTASSCPSQACSFDTCASGCLNSQSCNGSGVCTCTVDSDCKSHWCNAGACVTTRGACTCSADNECNLVSGTNGELGCKLSKSVCFTARAATTTLQGNYRTRESAAFGGVSSPGWIHAADVGTSSPLVGINDLDAIEVDLDFRFEGGTLPQTLFNSNVFSVQIVSGAGNTTVVQAQYKATGALVAAPITLEGHRWYRVISHVCNVCETGNTSGILLNVQAMDLMTSTYNGLLSGCGYKGAGILGASGDLWFGVDSATNANPFNGRLDNVAVYNYIGRGRPANCTLVP